MLEWISIAYCISMTRAYIPFEDAASGGNQYALSMRTLCALVLLMLLGLATAGATSPVSHAPEANISFGNRGTVHVIGPSNQHREEYPWSVVQTLRSPRGDAAVVRFCWEAVKYDGCELHLARPGQPVQVLKNGDVKHLLWTSDGQYLAGAGKNTIRLWNLSGGLRTLVLPASTSSVRALTWMAGSLCVQTLEYQHPGQYGQAAHRYKVPSLRWLTSVPSAKKWNLSAPACI